MRELGLALLSYSACCIVANWDLRVKTSMLAVMLVHKLRTHLIHDAGFLEAVVLRLREFDVLLAGSVLRKNVRDFLLVSVHFLF